MPHDPDYVPLAPRFPSPIGRGYKGASPYVTLPGRHLPAPGAEYRTIIIPGDPQGEGLAVGTGPSCAAAPVPPITIGQNADNCFDIPYDVSAQHALATGEETPVQLVARIADLVGDIRLPQNAREREHPYFLASDGPAHAFEFDLNTAADLVIPAAGVSVIVIRFLVPKNRAGVLSTWGRAFRFTNVPAAAAPPIWELHINGRRVVEGFTSPTDQLYASVFDVSPGFMRIPSQFLEPVRFLLEPEDELTLVLTGAAGEPGARGAAARLLGWTFPQQWVRGSRYFTPCDR